MLDNIWIGLVAVFQWQHFVGMFIATVVGLLVGVMPGLGPITAMALLIPFTFTMDPLSALLALASISVAANCSGAFSSILLNVPGETSSAATCFDGHPMASQGRATVAIGLSIGASFFAAVIGVMTVIADRPAAGDRRAGVRAAGKFRAGGDRHRVRRLRCRAARSPRA